MTGLRTTLLTVVPPLVVAGVSIALLLSLDLPARIAVHWDFDGVDNVAGVGDLVAPIAVFVPIWTAVSFAVLLFGTHRPTNARFGRFVVVMSAFVSLLVSLLMLAVALAQVGLSDASQVSSGRVLGYSLIALPVSVGIAGALAALTPLTPTVAAPPTGAPALPLAANERASWSRSVGPSRLVLIILGTAIVATVVVLVVAGAPLVLTLVVALVLIAVVGLLFWRVTVDSRGITVRPALGVPRFHVGPAQIDEARAIPVDPLRQFGGWGIRIGPSGWGIVVRSGDAIEVARVGKSPFIVTVDDAATGAALLTAVARAARTDA